MKIIYVVGNKMYGGGIRLYGDEHVINYREIKYGLMNENLSNGSVVKIDNILYRIEFIRIISAKVVKLWLTVHVKP